MDLYGLTVSQEENCHVPASYNTVPKKIEITIAHQNRVENQYIQVSYLLHYKCEIQNHKQDTEVNDFQLKSSIPSLD